MPFLHCPQICRITPPETGATPGPSFSSPFPGRNNTGHAATATAQDQYPRQASRIDTRPPPDSMTPPKTEAPLSSGGRIPTSISTLRSIRESQDKATPAQACETAPYPEFWQIGDGQKALCVPEERLQQDTGQHRRPGMTQVPVKDKCI